MDNKTLIKIGFLNALGTFAYTSLLMFVLFNAEKWFTFPQEVNFLQPVLVLTLFMISATITSSLVLGRPIYLITKGKIRDGIMLLVATILCLSLMAGGVLLVVTQTA